MLLKRLIVGVVLFFMSAYLANWIIDFTGIQFIVSGHDYAYGIIEKFLSVLGGSFIVWGVLKNPSVRRSKY